MDPFTRETVELEAPIGSYSYVGRQRIAQAGSHAVKNCAFRGEARFMLRGPSKIEKPEKLELIRESAGRNSGEDPEGGELKLKVSYKRTISIEGPLFIASNRIVAADSKLFARE